MIISWSLIHKIKHNRLLFRLLAPTIKYQITDFLIGEMTK